MKTSKKLLPEAGLTLLILVATVFGFSGTPRANGGYDSKYRVFCANGKIEVEQRTLEQEKNARGSSVCQLAEFDTLSDAEKDAEKRGGKDAECKCS